MSLPKRFVKVVWMDAQDEGHTWVPEDAIKPFTEAVCEVTSWGWLVGESKRYVTLAADYILDGVYGRVTKIPKGMILKIVDFKQD